MRASILALTLLCSVAAGARTWTLDECIGHATANNITVRQQQLAVRNAELGVTDARSGYLPQVSASAGQSWNLGRGLTAENTYADRNTSSFNWSGSLQVPVFNGLRTPRQVRYAKANLAQVAEQYEAAKDNITINVITSYLQVLYDKEMIETARHQVDLSNFDLSRRRALLDGGKIPEIDMLEAESQLAADSLSLVQAQNDEVLARINLAQLLCLGEEDIADFDVVPLSDPEAMIIPAEEAYRLALQHNHSVRAARLGLDTSDRNISLAKSGYLPQLSFGASVGSSYYKLSGMPNESFGDQMRHNYSTYFGFSLNIPIFDGFSTRNSVRRARVERINAELQLDQAEQQLFHDIQQAYYQATGAERKLASSRTADRTATRAYEAMAEKYALGRATPADYETAKNRAYRTAADLVAARYELILRSRLLAFYYLGPQASGL